MLNLYKSLNNREECDMGTPTFEEQVNTAINSMTEVEGKQVFAEGVTDDVKFAANAVRRQKDTQAAYTKNQQELKALTSENEQLASSWAQDVTKTLTVEQQSDLEELKHSNPEAWREKVNAYEQENATTVQTKHSEIKKKVNEESELDRRTRVLEEFNTNNPTIALTDDVIENDVPPRFSKQLEAGEITFEEFINKYC